MLGVSAVALPVELDPLIAEAKERARRRRLLALGAVVVVAAAAVGATIGLRSTGNALGVCATAPSSWKERTVNLPGPAPPTVVLTNFRFGRLDYVFGLGDDTLRWPRGGVAIAVMNEGPSATPRFRSSLRVRASDFGAFEGMRHPFVERAIRSNGRVLDAFVEVGSVTPATVAAANQALAGVRVCTA